MIFYWIVPWLFSQLAAGDEAFIDLTSALELEKFKNIQNWDIEIVRISYMLQGERSALDVLEICRAFAALKVLNTSGVDLHFVNTSSFSACKGIEVIDLSNNSLSSVNGFKRLTTLKELRLQGNRLLDVDEFEVVNFLPNLKTLRVEGNLFECTKLERQVTFFKKQGIKFTGPKLMPKSAKAPQFIGNLSCLPAALWSRQLKESILNDNFPISNFLSAAYHAVDYVQGQSLVLSQRALDAHQTANEEDFSRIETQLAELSVLTADRFDELNRKVETYTQSADNQLDTLGRLIWFCCTLLTLFVVVAASNFVRKPCQPNVMKRTSICPDDNVPSHVRVPLRLEERTPDSSSNTNNNN